MARTILPDTKTINFGELIGNGRVFQAPPYQRDYSWKEEHWEDLWADILTVRDSQEGEQSKHYTGALVVEARSDREYVVIDGQQRIATLSILALAVIARLQELAQGGIDSANNEERARDLRATFIGKKDPVSLTESSKLRLNANDGGFYQDVLVQLRQPRNPRGLSKSNQLLWQCFEWFGKQVMEISRGKDGGTALAHLLDEVVARRLLFILITVDNELNAYTVFETLNARGLELSATDLLKNYLFSRVRSPQDLETLQRRWMQLVGTVRQEKFPEFLRYHLLCEQPKIRQQRLFKLIREQVESGDDVFDLMEALEARSDLYSALSDESHGFWIDRPENKEHVRELRLFGVKQMTPLLFAAWEKLDRDGFRRVMKLVVVISFRYTVIGGLNTNELEPVYHAAAKALLEGRATGPAEVFQALRRIYVPDSKFEKDFSTAVIETQGKRKKLAKYILSKLEGDRRGQPVDAETDPGTIEHILPESPGEEWEEAIPRNRWEENIYRLGNLTLLEAASNRGCGRAAYGAKRVEYEKSGYQLAREIAGSFPDEWTQACIERRQERMAQRAVHIWRSDFE